MYATAPSPASEIGNERERSEPSTAFVPGSKNGSQTVRVYPN